MRGNRKRRGILHGTFLALAAAVFLAMSVGGTNAYAYENTIGVVKEGDARIRSSSSTDSTVLASVLSGDRLEICGMETGADGYTWYKVYVDRSTIGYVRSDRITDTGEKTGGVTDDHVTGNAGQNTNTPQDDNSQDTPQDTVIAEDPQDTPDDIEIPQDTTDLPVDTTPVATVEGAKLQSIGLGSNVSMTPAFSPDVTEYTILVDENTTSIAVFGVPAEGASVTENYGFDDLKRGSNMAVITVQAADGTTKSYYFTVNRGEASAEIHYAQPGTDGEGTQSGQADAAQNARKGGNSGWIVFLLVVILAMAAVIVLMGLRLRDYRRELYGEDPEEFHLKDALPDNSVFRKVFSQKTERTFGREERKTRTSRLHVKQDPDEEDDAYEADVYEDDDVYDDEDVHEAASEETQDFMYDVRQTAEDAAQIQDPGMRYQSSDEPDIEPEDDELEDIMERNATITDRDNGKEVWKSVNFMTPSDDLEFEFIELEDENE
ncbi:MAG: SH3 domain-containing protein [Lachnospiraceae bacterium]